LELGFEPISDSNAGLFALLANTEERAWLVRESQLSHRDLQASAVVEPGRWEGAF
jgi:hypothetical protein